MKKREAGLILLLALGSMWLVPYKIWGDITEGLLVFFGLLVAALVQVIPVTANFLQSDNLTLEEAKQFTGALERQQKYWLGLLGVSVVTCIALIVGKALPEQALSFSFSIREMTFEPSLQSAFSGLIASLVGLAIVKTFGFFPGVMSLQKLRGELVVNAAKRRLAEKVEQEAAARDPVRPFVDSNYGKIISPPH